MDWTLSEIWNMCLTQKPRTEFEPRDRIWASELYNAPIDLWHKLKGTNPSNVPDERSMKKFDAGNRTEFIIKLILLSSGIYKASQTRVMFEREGLLKVSGKLDFEAGGIAEANEEVKKLLDLLEVDDYTKRQAKNIVSVVKSKYPEGLKDKILEIKSVATFGMNKILLAKKPLEGHDLQAFHYAYNTGRDVELFYVCRDDWRSYSFVVKPDDPVLLKKYLGKIEEITSFSKMETEPPKEPLISYDSTEGKFARNFTVQYSSYLKMLYGFNHPEEYADWFKKEAGSWNRVLGRIARGQKMTPKNEDILKQIEAKGFDLAFIKENVIELASKGLVSEEEEE